MNRVLASPRRCSASAASPRACGSARAHSGRRLARARRAEQRGDRHPRVSAVAGRTGASGRAARAAIDASRHGSPRRSTSAIPTPRIRWRYRLVLNGAAVVVPNSALGRLRGAPRRQGGRRRRDVHGQPRPTRQGREGGRDVADRAPQSGRRDQDRDHRRRRRPDAPVLRSAPATRCPPASRRARPRTRRRR